MFNLQLFASADYWRKREEQNLKSNLKQEDEYDKEIERIYKDMLDATQKEIDAFYGKYADAEGITLAEAKKKVSQLDIEAYERKAKKYVEAASQDRANTGKTNKRAFYFSKRANEEMRLYNLTMKVNRLEMLKANIGLELIKGHAELETFMSEILRGRTQEELERQAGILGKSIKNNAKTAHTIVNASFHNATFSDRLWMYHDQMKADLSKLLQSGMIQGKNSRKLAKDLRKYYYGPEYLKNGKKGAVYNTERLMRTELARVQTEAQRQSFERNGFTEYTFLALADCCEICAAINGKHFKVKDMMPGDNAPPMHPWCRCSTSAYEDSKEYEAWLDYLESGGTTEGWNKLSNKEKSRIISDINARNGGKINTGIPYLDKKGALKKHDIEDCYNTTNPKYNQGREYKVNCQRCVSAYEARRRGIDVTAKPRPQGYDTLPYMTDQKGWANVYDNGLNSLETVGGRTGVSVRNNICKKMSAYGDGARAIVRVRWSRGNSGHVFIAEQVNGETRFIDPQPGKEDVSHYFERGMIKPSDTRLLRIDDKKFTDLIEQCVE